MLDYSKKQAHILRANKQLVDELLATNTNNRNIKRKHQKWLESAIKDKEFILTSQGIGVSSKGILVDGQHRLAAIREAGYPPVELLVVTGLDGKSMMYVDQHAKRSTADMLKVFLDKNITTRMASIINSHLKISETEDGFSWQSNKPSLDEITKAMEEYLVDLELLTSAGGNQLRAGMYAALFHYYLRYDKNSALELAQQINTGEKLLRGDPAYKLREHMMGTNRRVSYGSSGQMLDYRYTVTGCIAHAKGEKIESLRPANSWIGLESVGERYTRSKISA